MKTDQLFLVGKIAKAQGIKGEVKVLSYMDTPDVLCDLPYIIAGDRRYLIKKSRSDRTMAYLLLDSISDRNAAEALKNTDIYIERQDVPKPAEGRYYIEDLIGATVSDDTGELIGKLHEIIQSGASDIYVIKAAKGTVMVPLTKSVLCSIDIDQNVIVLNSERLEEVAVYDN